MAYSRHAKAGLLDGLITIIRSFHDGMEAVMATAGGTTQPILAGTGKTNLRG